MFTTLRGLVRTPERDEEILDGVDSNASLGRLGALRLEFAARAVRFLEFGFAGFEDDRLLSCRACNDSSSKIDVEVVFGEASLVRLGPRSGIDGHASTMKVRHEWAPQVTAVNI